MVVEEKKKDLNKDEKRGSNVSFPAPSTRDAVRLKCRELLLNALRIEGGNVIAIVFVDECEMPRFLFNI